MKKKNGFISISVVYAFFVVFLLVLMTIITEYANNRLLMKSVKDDIINELNDRTTKFLSTYLIENMDEYAIYYHDETLTNGANDLSYRFSGADTDVANYICFGSDENPCPPDNLYRIIGIFHGSDGETNLKIIKASILTHTIITESADEENINQYYWSGSIYNISNDWYYSDLESNTLRNYLATFDSKWQNIVANTNWYIGGYENSTAYNALSVYNHEAGISAIAERQYASQTGLMYLSDYMYATTPEEWSTSIATFASSTSNNWLHQPEIEWVITPDSATTSNVYRINSDGTISTQATNTSATVRPVLYLKTAVYYVSGDGSLSSPFRIT